MPQDDATGDLLGKYPPYRMWRCERSVCQLCGGMFGVGEEHECSERTPYELVLTIRELVRELGAFVESRRS